MQWKQSKQTKGRLLVLQANLSHLQLITKSKLSVVRTLNCPASAKSLTSNSNYKIIKTAGWTWLTEIALKHQITHEIRGIQSLINLSLRGRIKQRDKTHKLRCNLAIPHEAPTTLPPVNSNNLLNPSSKTVILGPNRLHKTKTPLSSLMQVKNFDFY